MSNAAVNLLLNFNTITELLPPPGDVFWSDSAGDDMIASDGSYLVFNPGS